MDTAQRHSRLEHASPSASSSCALVSSWAWHSLIIIWRHTSTGGAFAELRLRLSSFICIKSIRRAPVGLADRGQTFVQTFPWISWLLFLFFYHLPRASSRCPLFSFVVAAVVAPATCQFGSFCSLIRKSKQIINFHKLYAPFIVASPASPSCFFSAISLSFAQLRPWA